MLVCFLLEFSGFFFMFGAVLLFWNCFAVFSLIWCHYEAFYSVLSSYVSNLPFFDVLLLQFQWQIGHFLALTLRRSFRVVPRKRCYSLCFFHVYIKVDAISLLIVLGG